MPNNVEERVVEMRFDNGQFEKNAKESISTLQRLKQALNFGGVKTGLDDMSKSIKNFSINGMVSNISNGIDEINNRFGIFGRTINNIKQDVADTLTNVATQTVKTVSSLSGMSQWAQEVASATSLVSRSIQEMSPAANMGAGWDKYAKKTTAVQTIMNATGKSIGEVESQLEELMWFSDETSYSFTDMTSNVGKFTSQNIDLETSVKAMMGIANAAALAGANSTEASRAMYNVSQAMGKGYMQLIDWKSIENANMATTQLKQSMIDAAVSVGTLIDRGDGLYSTLDGAEVSVENFTSELSKGWMSTDAMLEAFQRYGGYADVVFQKATEEGLTCAEAMEALGLGYDELGVKAFKAAQEAKTFTDMVEATKDAVGSQWARIFQEIFGNYEEARKVWTWWANEFWDLFAGPLSDVADLFKEWHEGGGFWTAVETAKTGWEGLMELISGVKNSWETAFPKETVEDFLNATDRALGFMERFKSGVESFFGTNEEINETVRLYQNMSDKIRHIADADYAGNTYKAALEYTKDNVLKYMDGLDELAAEFYGGDKMTAAYSIAQMYLKQYYDQYAEALQITNEAEVRNGYLQKTFKGLASALDIVKTAGKSFNEVFIKPIIGDVPGALEWVLKKTAKIGAWTTNLSNKLKENGTFTKFFTRLRDPIVKVSNTVKTFFERVSKLESVQKLLNHLKNFGKFLLELPLNVLDKLTEFFSGLKKATGFTMDDAVNAFDRLIQALNFFIEGVENHWPTIVGWLDKFGETVQGVAGSIADFFNGPDWEAAKGFFKNIFGDGSDLRTALNNIGNWFTTFIDEKIKNGELKELGKNGAKTVFEGVQEYFGQDVDWMDALKNIAVTAFMVKIADSLIKIMDGLAKASEGIGKLPDTLIKFFNGLGGVFQSMKRDMNASAMLKIAASIGILVLAMYGIGAMPEDVLKKATEVITQIGLIITIIIFALGKYNTAKAQRSLASAASIFDALNTFADHLGKGVKRFLTLFGLSTVITSVGATILMIAVGIGVIVGAILLLNKFGGNNIDNTINSLMRILQPILFAVEAIIVAGSILSMQGRDLYRLAAVFKEMGKVFKRIAEGLLIVVASIAILSYMDSKGLKIDEASKMLLKIAIGLTAIVLALALIGKLVGTNGLDSIGKVLTKLAASFLIITVSLVALAKLCDPDALKVAAQALLAAGVAITAIVLAMTIFAAATKDNVMVEGNLEALSSAMIKMAASIFIIAAAAALLAYTGATIEDVAKAVVSFIVVLLVLVGLGALLGFVPEIAAGLQALGLALLMVGSAVAVTGIGILALAAGIKLLADNTEAIPAVFQAIGEGVVAFTNAINEGGGKVGQFIAVMATVALVAIAVSLAFGVMAAGIALVLYAIEPFLEKLISVMPKIKTVVIAGATMVVVGLLEYLTGSMGDFVDTVIKLILLAINSIAAGIVNNAAAIGDAIRNVLLAIGDLFIEAFLNFWEPLIEKVPILKDLIDVDSLHEMFGASLLEDINGDMADLRNGINDNLERIKGDVNTKVDDTKNKMSELGSASNSNLGTGSARDEAFGRSAGEKDGAEYAGGWTDALKNSLGGNMANFGLSGMAGGNMDLSGFSNMFTTTGEDAGTGLTDGISNSLDGYDLGGAMNDYGAAGVDGFESGYNTGEMLGMVGGFGGDGASTLASYTGQWFDSGENLGESTDSGLGSKEGDVMNTSSEISRSGANSMQAPAKYYHAGQMNMQGYIDGINSKVGELNSAVRSATNGAINTVAITQDSRSPSRITTVLGKYFTQGFINGILALRDRLNSTVKNVGTGALDTLNYAAESAERLLSSVDFDPTIRPVLDLTDFNSGINTMNSMFTGYQPRLSYAGIGDIPNLGSINASFSNMNNNDDVVTAIQSLQSDVNYLGEELANMQIVMDSGAIVGSTTKRMDQSLGRVARYKSRGN